LNAWNKLNGEKQDQENIDHRYASNNDKFIKVWL